MSDTYDPHGVSSLPLGTAVVAANGEELGQVREVHPHYVLVGHEGGHADLDVPVHALARYDGERLYLKINREALTVVDDDDSAHRRLNTE